MHERKINTVLSDYDYEQRDMEEIANTVINYTQIFDRMLKICGKVSR